MAGLIDSPQALLLVLLAVAGALFVWFRSEWELARKQEFYLCAFLTIVLAAHVSSAHPTFARYYLFTTPFVSYLAAAGIYFAGSRLWSPERPWLPVIIVCAIMALNAAKNLYDVRDDLGWGDLEKTAAKVKEVAPPGRPLLADEAIFFLLHRLPEPILASRDSHKLSLPRAQEELLHIINRADLQQQVESGKYYAAEYCEEEGWFTEEHLAPLFKNKAEVGDCRVFWDPKAR